MKKSNEFTEPELYDIFNNDCSDDIAWNIDYCKKYKDILELGIGTGRIAIPLAQCGHDVWGVDNSPDMLRVLRKKMKTKNISNIHIIEQDVCTLKLNSKFAIALIPFCMFNFLLSSEEQCAALLSLRECTTEDAVLIFELITPWTFFVHQNKETFMHYRSFEYNSKNVAIYLKNDFNGQDNILTQNRLFRIDDEEKEIIMKNCIISVEKFQKLLNLCGYEISETYGDFNNNPYKEDSTSLIVIVKKVHGTKE